MEMPTWCQKNVRVAFQHSEDTGTIVAILASDLVRVRLDAENLEIPVFIEDIAPIETQVEGKKEPTTSKEILGAWKPQDLAYTVLHPKGIQIAFVPILDSTKEPTGHFHTYLINDTSFDQSYTVSLHVNEFRVWQEEGRLDHMTFKELPSFELGYLNDHSELRATFHRISTEGPGPRQEKMLKLKPKTFFQQKIAPLVNLPAHVFILLEKQGGHEVEEKRPQVSLKEYTVGNAKPLAQIKQNTYPVEHSVHRKAAFSIELDLHLENLDQRGRKLTNGQILQLQMQVFEQYIEEAYRQGVDRVFIIHGVGKGELKNRIFASLMQHPKVGTFRNEYHPRYGYGATEVIFP